MNVTPVTNDTANDGEQLANNEEAQAVNEEILHSTDIMSEEMQRKSGVVQ